MSDGIEQVKTAFAELLNNISKPRRRLLYQQIGRELARNTRRRIKTQQNPDGTAFEARKKPKRLKAKVRDKRKAQMMFQKIGNPAHLKRRNEQEGISLGFMGNDARIAEIHQFGKVAKVQPHLRYKVKYARRELLGFTEEDREMIETFVIKALTGK